MPVLAFQTEFGEQVLLDRVVRFAALASNVLPRSHQAGQEFTRLDQLLAAVGCADLGHRRGVECHVAVARA
jgi:hypothetical protein